MQDLKQISNDLERCKEAIDKASEEKSKNQGRLDETMEYLKREFGVETVEAGEAKLEKMKSRLETLQTGIEAKYTKLKDLMHGKVSS